MKKYPLLSSLLIAFTLSGVSLGQSVTLVSQDRSVRSEGYIHTSAQTIEELHQRLSPGFGAFQANVLSDLSFGGATAVAYSDQLSDVNPSRIYARGVCHAQASGFGTNSGQAGGRTALIVDFQVHRSVNFLVCGSLIGSDAGYGDASLRMGTTSIFNETAGVGGSYQQLPLDLNGILLPGTYQFRATAYGTVIDGFGSGSFDLLLSFEALQSNYCLGSPNSVGAGAVMGATGSHSIADNQFSLNVAGAVPGTVGLFYYGPDQAQLPLGNGFRCVGGSITRFAPQLTSAGGQASTPLSLGSFGDFEPGVPLNFQYWYRDPAAGGAGYNLSDGLQVVFCP